MKIDFKKLKEIETQFCSSQKLPGDIHTSSELSLFTLQQMIKIILEYNNSNYTHATSNVKLAIETLKSLQIIVDEPGTVLPLQQLNS